MAQIKINSNIIFCACEKFLISYKKKFFEIKNNENNSSMECSVNSDIYIRKYSERRLIIINLSSMSKYADQSNFNYLILTEDEFNLLKDYL